MPALLLAALSSSAPAQSQANVPLVGVLRASSATQHDPGMDALRQALDGLGYTVGHKLKIEQRFANRQTERLPQLAAELVEMKPKVIIAVNEASLRAAMRATSTIPIIVIAYDHDPVAAGLIDSVSRPGGNVTGIFSRQVELSGKRLELLKETVPRLSRVAVLFDPAGRHSLGEVQKAAKRLGVQLRLVELKDAKGFEGAFKLVRGKAQGALLLFSPALFDYRIRIASLAIDTNLPIITQADEFVVAGALMSYAPDRAEIAGRTAYLIDRLLRGARPADLPVEEAARFRLTVNLKTAKALGLTVPESILIRANEVIR